MTKVYTSAVINAPADSVWETIRDFNALPDWHPAIARSEIEDGLKSDQIGCIRHFVLQDGGVIREKLLSLSDQDRSCTYSILVSPMGVDNYMATLKLTPITVDQRCFAQWSAEFDCDSSDEADLIKLIGDDVFAAGFAALNDRLQDARRQDG